MIKSLRYQILECLHNHNAIDNTIDIKFDFLDKLETVKKRKEFKVELDFLIAEGLISGGPFEFLNWELISGLYPLDNKTISVKLTRSGYTYIRSTLEPGYVDTTAADDYLVDDDVQLGGVNANSAYAPGSVVSYLIVKDGAQQNNPVQSNPIKSKTAPTVKAAGKAVAAQQLNANPFGMDNTLQALAQISLVTKRAPKPKIPLTKILLQAGLALGVLILTVLVWYLTRSRY